MKIYVLIIVCLFTLGSILALKESEGNKKTIATLILVAMGILAIIFQALSF